MQKLLKDLLPFFKHSIVAVDTKTQVEEDKVSGVSINGIVFDSRTVKPGNMFFALPGTHTTGNAFIMQALEKGASVIVFQDEIDHDVQIEIAKFVSKIIIEQSLKLHEPQQVPVFIKVEDTRYCMAPVSNAFYDSPSSKMKIIGVTGTEGKSSVVFFIWQLLRSAGRKAGFISTVQYSLGGDAENNPEHQTTPEAPIIQRQLYEMLQNDCEYAVVESSSHGLSKKLNRLGCVLFDCAVFMNVTLEHLEFHKTFEQYRYDKANLFRALDEHDHEKIIRGKKCTVPALGVVNLEDESFQYFMNATKKPVYGFTTEGKAGKFAGELTSNATPLPEIPEYMRYMKAENIASARFGLSFHLETDGASAEFKPDYDPAVPRSYESFNVQVALPGAFNTCNVMAALIAVSGIAELPFEFIVKNTNLLKPLKGRMTTIDYGQPFEVIVDYAHTPSSFETIFPPLRKRCSGRMICLFGSGGERDLKKRPLQGEIAAHFCDLVYLCDEDPRGEDPVELLKMISVGAEKEGKQMNENLFIIPDRKKAIREVFNTARQGDIVLLLGKSHENSIIYKDYVMPYDEISEAQAALSEKGYISK